MHKHRKIVLNANIVEIMVGTKKKVYKERKEKERVFWSSETSEKRDTETTKITSPTPSRSHECPNSESEVEGSIGASIKKMKLQSLRRVLL